MTRRELLAAAAACLAGGKKSGETLLIRKPIQYQAVRTLCFHPVAFAMIYPPVGQLHFSQLQDPTRRDDPRRDLTITYADGIVRTVTING